MGAVSDPGGAIKVLEFLLAMLQLANADGRVEEAVPAGKGLLALARGGGRQLEPYVQALLKNTNRMIMYCLLPSSPSDGFGEDSLSTSFRRSSDSLLRSFDSLRHTAEGGSGESGVSSQEIDKATVLQLILANKKLVFCASNVDAELLCALCWNVTPLLWDPEPSTRNLAVDVWRALVTYRSSALEDILIWRGTQVCCYTEYYLLYMILSCLSCHFINSPCPLISEIVRRCTNIILSMYRYAGCVERRCAAQWLQSSTHGGF